LNTAFGYCIFKFYATIRSQRQQTGIAETRRNSVQGWTVALVSERAVSAAIRQQRELLWQNQGQR
jgi:hypothetical protein